MTSLGAVSSGQISDVMKVSINNKNCSRGGFRCSCHTLRGLCGCVCEGSLQPQLRKDWDVILYKSHINTSQTNCLGPCSLSLHYTCINIYLYICIYFHRALTAETSTNILPHQLLCSSHYSEFQDKERPGKRCIWLAPEWTERGRWMNHVHELRAHFSWHSGFSSLMALWFILSQRF